MAFSDAIAAPGANGSSLPDFLSVRVDRYYRERVHETWGDRHILRGRIPGPGAVLLNNNDYLCIAAHPRIIEAQTQELARSGNGLMMSGVFVHDNSPLVALEARYAAFLGAEAAVLCQSGYCANTGLLQSIAGPDVPVYLDMLAHLSLWEGVQSAGAPGHAFRHNDANHLENLIRRHGPGVIVVDSVYSSNGSICPLVDVAEIATRHGCVLVVDESHSLGTHGDNGEGLVASLGLTEQVHFVTVSLAKAFASRAGLITCSARFVDYFKCNARPAVFSSTLLPHEIAGLGAALEVVRSEGWRRERLHTNAAMLRAALTGLGYNLEGSESQIIALEAGPEPRTIQLRDALEARDVFGAVFCAPATANNRSMVRFTVNSSLTDAELAHVVRVCDEIRAEVDMASWPSTLRGQRAARRLAA